MSEEQHPPCKFCGSALGYSCECELKSRLSPRAASSREGKEELRPCPFCGKSAQVSKEYEGYIFCECIDDDGSVYDDDWNSAWCWKEIDRLKEDCAHKEMDNFSLKSVIDGWKDDKNTWTGAQKEILKLKAQNKKMREALEKYKPIAVESRFWAEEALKGE